MAISKEFIEAAAKDESLEVEAMRAAYDALGEFLEEKGLENEANQIMDAAVEKVAEAHGFAPADEDELSLDNLEEVSGGTEIIFSGGAKIIAQTRPERADHLYHRDRGQCSRGTSRKTSRKELYG